MYVQDMTVDSRVALEGNIVLPDTQVEELNLNNTDESSNSFSSPDVTWVYDLDGLKDFLQCLVHVRKGEPDVAVDCEDSNGLSRSGTLTHLTFSILPLHHTWVICVNILGISAFDTVGASGKSIRNALEDRSTPQLWFDARADSDALFGQYGIRLGNVIDIQIMELCATFNKKRTNFNSLKNSVKEDGPHFMPASNCTQWVKEKVEGRKYFTKQGWGILNYHPLPAIAQKYTVGDTFVLFGLYQCYLPRILLAGKMLHMNMQAFVHVESLERVWNSKLPAYKPAKDSIAPKVFSNLPIAETQAYEKRLLRWQYYGHISKDTFEDITETLAFKKGMLRWQVERSTMKGGIEERTRKPAEPEDITSKFLEPIENLYDCSEHNFDKLSVEFDTESARPRHSISEGEHWVEVRVEEI